MFRKGHHAIKNFWNMFVYKATIRYSFSFMTVMFNQDTCNSSTYALPLVFGKPIQYKSLWRLDNLK